MHPKRKRRLFFILFLVGGIVTATGFALYAFSQNMMFYFTPTEVSQGKAPLDRIFRMGGLVVKGSFKQEKTGLKVYFDLTDYGKTVGVQYTGILPDLFREGQGIIAKGKLNAQGVFIADEVLAKHDEKYMPPEVAASLKKSKTFNPSKK